MIAFTLLVLLWFGLLYWFLRTESGLSLRAVIVAHQVAAPVLGSVVYYLLISLGLAIGLKPADLKLVTGVFVLLMLALPALKKRSQVETLRE